MAIRTVTRAGVGLVVGIIILGLLVLGGLWLVRERGEQARRDEAINIANQQLQSESDKEVATDTDKDKESTDKTPTTDKAPSKDGEATEAIPTTSTAPAAVSELPKTGPEAVSFVAIGLLSFATVSFIRSRKLASNRV